MRYISKIDKTKNKTGSNFIVMHFARTLLEWVGVGDFIMKTFIEKRNKLHQQEHDSINKNVFFKFFE